MAQIIVMPKLGFNMNEGKLVRWYKKEGDIIRKGDIFFSVETDKTNIDIEATADGYVRRLLVQEGEMLAVTLPIAIIGEQSENIENVLENDPMPGKGEPASTSGILPDRVQAISFQPTSKRITPRAKRIAKEKGIDLESVPARGSGYQGGICAADILAFAESSRKVRSTPVARGIAAERNLDLSTITGTGEQGKIMKRDVEAVCEQKTNKMKTIPYQGVRKIIGDRLSASKAEAPHVYFTHKINAEQLLEVRKHANNDPGFKISVTDCIVKATTMALQQFPEMNASLRGEVIEQYSCINMGIAVASPTGLIVPVVRDCQTMSVSEIARETAALVEKAREGKLRPDEYSGGTFTISNLGMFGIENFTAVINPPEAGILAVSAIKDSVVVLEKGDGGKEIAVRPMLNITLSVDHRVVDGLLAAQFIGHIKELLEQPVRLFI